MSTARAVEMSLFPDIQPDKPVGPILPSVFVGTNAELMRAVAPLYLTGSVLDVTYGEGKWWTLYRPDQFTAHDKFKGDGVDFTALPEDDNTYDTVVFDPPYVKAGRALKSTRGDFMRRYGLGGLGDQAFYSQILDGLAESARVARTHVLMKCMEFAQGGRFHDVPVVATNWAKECGLTKHDQIVHHSGAGPGGHNIFDPKRARRHHSYLLVFTKERK